MADQSPKNLAEALALFQSKNAGVAKDGSAQYGSYPTLAAGIVGSQPAAKFGLSHTQTFDYFFNGENGNLFRVLITTLRFAKTDEKIESKLILPELPKTGNVMQQLGSATTYARRYGLLAIYGLAGEDDDGEGSGPQNIESTRSAVPKTPPQSKPRVIKKTEPKKEAPKFEVNFAKPERITRIKRKLNEMWETDQEEVLLAFKVFKENAKISADRATIANVVTEEHCDILEPIIGL
tara:strand:- start:2392 stop:3099 length:708 start_codon:yes stop_codon:yes gene_type:complete